MCVIILSVQRTLTPLMTIFMNGVMIHYPDVSGLKYIVCDMYYEQKYRDACDVTCACDIPSSDDSDDDSDMKIY